MGGERGLLSEYFPVVDFFAVETDWADHFPFSVQCPQRRTREHGIPPTALRRADAHLDAKALFRAEDEWAFCEFGHENVGGAQFECV